MEDGNIINDHILAAKEKEKIKMIELQNKNFKNDAGISMKIIMKVWKIKYFKEEIFIDEVKFDRDPKLWIEYE